MFIVKHPLSIIALLIMAWIAFLYALKIVAVLLFVAVGVGVLCHLARLATRGNTNPR